VSAAEEKLSPEEKLLRVIQGGKKDKSGDAPEVAAAGVETISDEGANMTVSAGIEEHDGATVAGGEAVEVSASAADRLASAPPRLKLADPIPSGGEDAISPESPESPAAGQEDSETTVAVAAIPEDAVKRKRFSPTYGINVANKVLAIAILVVLLLTGFQIWSQVRASQVVIVPEQIEVEQRLVDAALPDLKKLIDEFSRRALFEVIEKVELGPVRGGPEAPARGLKLLGLSKNDEGVQEAILMDKDGNMKFLREGDELESNGTQLRVLRIESDSIVFVDDWDREWTIKP
jgi:hypothetical protein